MQAKLALESRRRARQEQDSRMRNPTAGPPSPKETHPAEGCEAADHKNSSSRQAPERGRGPGATAVARHGRSREARGLGWAAAAAVAAGWGPATRGEGDARAGDGGLRQHIAKQRAAARRADLDDQHAPPHQGAWGGGAGGPPPPQQQQQQQLVVPLTWQELRLAAEEGFGELLRQQEEEGGRWMEEGRTRRGNHPPHRARPLPTAPEPVQVKLIPSNPPSAATTSRRPGPLITDNGYHPEDVHAVGMQHAQPHPHPHLSAAQHGMYARRAEGDVYDPTLDTAPWQSQPQDMPRQQQHQQQEQDLQQQYLREQQSQQQQHSQQQHHLHQSQQQHKRLQQEEGLNTLLQEQAQQQQDLLMQRQSQQRVSQQQRMSQQQQQQQQAPPSPSSSSSVSVPYGALQQATVDALFAGLASPPPRGGSSNSKSSSPQAAAHHPPHGLSSPVRRQQHQPASGSSVDTDVSGMSKVASQGVAAESARAAGASEVQRSDALTAASGSGAGLEGDSSTSTSTLRRGVTAVARHRAAPLSALFDASDPNDGAHRASIRSGTLSTDGDGGSDPHQQLPHAQLLDNSSASADAGVGVAHPNLALQHAGQGPGHAHPPLPFPAGASPLRSNAALVTPSIIDSPDLRQSAADMVRLSSPPRCFPTPGTTPLREPSHLSRPPDALSLTYLETSPSQPHDVPQAHVPPAAAAAAAKVAAEAAAKVAGALQPSRSPSPPVLPQPPSLPHRRSSSSSLAIADPPPPLRRDSPRARAPVTTTPASPNTHSGSGVGGESASAVSAA
ncbi:MAG: hypothetical protein WDW38_001046 [Sanguina aurantia]